MSRVIDWLRPRSDEGDVYRDRWIELFEPIYYGGGCFIALVSATSFADRRQWLLGAGFLAVLVAMLIAARFALFRPHLVIGHDTLVLVGIFGTRRLGYDEIRRAVAAKGSLKLVMTDHDEVYVPGLSRWSHAHGDCYSGIAWAINARIAERAATS